MASTEASKFPDFDSLINAAENDSGNGELLGEATSDKGSFNPDEYATIVQWYNEQSMHLQQHYGTHLEHQKQKLAEENEAGFLEALQQSLQSYESDHLSDLANLSSTLDHMNDTLEKPSRLKELLLSPFSDNYSREINSPQHAVSHIKKFGNSSLCQNSNIKPRAEKKLKPFAELLKHMDALDKSIVETSNVKQTGTHLVSTEQYTGKHSSACDDKKDLMSQNVEEKPAGKRIVLHPVKSIPKSNVHGCKSLTLSLRPSIATRKKIPNAVLAGFPSNLCMQAKNTLTSPVTSASTIIAAFPSQVNKRCCTPTDNHSLPHKRQYLSPAAGQSVDHDYCTVNASSNTTGSSYSAKEGDEVNGKPAVQKVLRWQEYLQQVRVGVRSAPNSPTCSPKAARVSTQQSNNFMVVSLHGSHPHPPKYFMNTTAGRNKLISTVSVPEPLRKSEKGQECGLQELDKYLNVLQTDLKSPPPPVSEQLASVLTTPLNASCSNTTSNFSSTLSSRDAPAMYSLAAMVRTEQSKLKLKRASEAPKQSTTCANIATKVVPSTQALLGRKRGRPVGSSGQLLTIQVPITSNSVAARTASKNTPKTNCSTVPSQISTGTPRSKDLVPLPRPEAKSQQVPTFAAQPAPTFKLMTANNVGEESKSLILSGVNGKLKEILTLMAEQQAKNKAESKDGFSHDEQQLNTLQTLISCLGSQQQDAKTSTSCITEAASLSNQNVSKVVSKSELMTFLPQPNDISADSVQYSSDLSISKEITETGTAQLEESLEKKNFCTNHCNRDKSSSGNSANQNIPAHIVKQIDGNQLGEGSHVLLSPNDSATNEGPFAMQSADISNMKSAPLQCDSFTVKKDAKLEPANAEKFPRTLSTSRSTTAAEVLASDVMDDGTKEIMVYANPIEASLSSDKNNNELDCGESNGPGVISLEAALKSLENDEDLEQGNSGVISLSAADNLFCKLPSYFLTGKLVSEARDENMEGLKKRGMKNVHCDPLITEKGKKTEVEFNKLPHYLSSGKTRPSSPNCDVPLTPTTKSATITNGLAVKLHPVGNNQHITAQGTPVDTSETYYSRLPTYYSYGRPHLPVKTFNDDAADAKDDTVTTHTLEEDNRRSSKHRKRMKRKQKMKKKKQHKIKREDVSDDSLYSKKVLYSKLPSYYLSGRILPSNEKENSRRISPVRSSSVRSPSPRSLSCSSRSSRSRSPLRRSCGIRRRSSRSFSRSSSRSASDSEGEAWRKERSRRSRRERSYVCRSYNSSDEDHNELVRCREWDARRTSKQHQEAKEKDRQRAMEERRVVYVGGIDRKTTKQDLRRTFLRFGSIEAISLHFRDDGDNYGFLTFQYTCDAFRAIEEGSRVGPGEPRYDLCFGGRRQFCKTAYKDLDSKVTATDSKAEGLSDFDALLQQARRRRSIRR